MNFKALDLLHFTEDQIWAIPDNSYAVEFADTAITMTNRQIHFSWYYWRFYKDFPGVPMIAAGALNKMYSVKTHRELGGILIWHIKHNYSNQYPELLWDIAKCFLDITNDIYNMSCIRLSRFVTSASIHDLIELLDEPTIVEAKANYRRLVVESNYDENIVGKAIENVHNIVGNVLYTEPNYLKHNGIKQLCFTGIVNKGQMVQLIGPRGYVQDIDAEVFPYPIDNGYSEGLNTLYDATTESRSASRAIMMNVEPLQQSEWFNREVQLLMSSIHSVTKEPCGCSGYVTIKWTVEEDDLSLLKGKYYMHDNDPVLIWDTVAHLVGKVLDIRSITGCGNADVQTVCHICLGWSHNIIPPGTNVGYALTTALCAMISNRIMSTKHYEVSSSSMALELPLSARTFIRYNSKHKSKLFLADEAINHKVLIRIDIKFVSRLSQINHIDVSELSPARMTSIPVVHMVYLDSEGNPIGAFESIKLEVSGVGVHLTTDILHYLKKNGWTSHKNYIEFTLSGWKAGKAIFGIPRKGDNIYLFLNDVKLFIKPNSTSDTKITNFKTRSAALSEFVQLLKRRLDINLPQAEIFIRGCMAVSGSNKDYRLPHPSQTNWEFVGLKQLLFHRSIAGMLAYQEQLPQLLDPYWYTTENNTTHLLDAILNDGSGY